VVSNSITACIDYTRGNIFCKRGKTPGKLWKIVLLAGDWAAKTEHFSRCPWETRAMLHLRARGFAPPTIFSLQLGMVGVKGIILARTQILIPLKLGKGIKEIRFCGRAS